jgi:hypothetical protein
MSIFFKLPKLNLHLHYSHRLQRTQTGERNTPILPKSVLALRMLQRFCGAGVSPAGLALEQYRKSTGETPAPQKQIQATSFPQGVHRIMQ